MRAPAVLAVVAMLGCGAPAATPEDQVRAVLAAIETAAEARDVGAMKQHVSEAYRDAHGNDRRALAGVATMHLLRHDAVHLLMRVRTVELPAGDAAHAVALVAMAGTPIDSAAAAGALRADLYRFELTLRDEDGTWRVTSAAWSPATADDFR